LRSPISASPPRRSWRNWSRACSLYHPQATACLAERHSVQRGQPRRAATRAPPGRSSIVRRSCGLRGAAVPFLMPERDQRRVPPVLEERCLTRCRRHLERSRSRRSSGVGSQIAGTRSRNDSSASTRVDPVGLARYRRQSLDPLRVSDQHLPKCLPKDLPKLRSS
jgi:hypothetical protein